MKKRVKDYIASCLVCQQHKYMALSPQGLLHPLPIPKASLEEVSMDFVVKLPKSKGFETIMVVVDWLSKYRHFIPIKHPYIARIIAEVFVKEMVRLHGIPMSIVSDRDPPLSVYFGRSILE